MARLTEAWREYREAKDLATQTDLIASRLDRVFDGEPCPMATAIAEIAADEAAAKRFCLRALALSERARGDADGRA